VQIASRSEKLGEKEMRFPGIAWVAFLLGYGLVTSSLPAQETNVPAVPAQNATPAAPSGLQIRSISAYANYESSFLPNGGTGFQPGLIALPADVGFGGSIAIEWSKFTERSSFSLDYTPSYTGYIRNSNLNALNHALSLTTSRKLAPRWTLGFSVGGNLSSMEQSIFAPSTLSNVASTPATFEDLAAGLLSSKFTNNPQLGTILGSSPLVQSPVANLIYGQRMFTGSTQVSLSYSYSPRFTLTFSGGAARTQYMSGSQASTPTNGYLLANTTSGNADLGFSYSLSPFTQIGGTVTVSRTTSSIFDAYTTTSLATLGRTFGTRWVLQLHGGIAVTNPVRQIYSATPTEVGPATGGSLAYKTLSHTFLIVLDRTVSDSYGLGAATSSTATASWHYRHPGSSWWLDSSFGWQQLSGGVLMNTAGWNTAVGLSRAISANVVLIAQYVHLDYSGGLLAAIYHTSQDAVRVSMELTPHPAAPR
jgi:hypothetical protein